MSTRVRNTKVFSRLGFVAILILARLAFGQGTYTAQLRGAVRDKSLAALVGATLTMTEDATAVSHQTTSNDQGLYIFQALRPSTYTLSVEAQGFRKATNRNIVLAVNQQAELDFTLIPAGSTTTVEVVDTAPLLDVGGASMGTEVTNEFISRMPLLNRDTTALVYLSAGVTELNNAGGGYPAGTSFSSNGQRYGSAEIRLDGGLAALWHGDNIRDHRERPAHFAGLAGGEYAADSLEEPLVRLRESLVLGADGGELRLPRHAAP